MFIGTYKSDRGGYTKIYVTVGTFEGFVRTAMLDKLKADGFTESQLSRLWDKILIEKMVPDKTNGRNAWNFSTHINHK
jgi:hypothetical protein